MSRLIPSASFSEDPSQVRFVFTVVHGTWASNAKWCNNNSEFCSQLGLEFPSHVIERFAWTGANSVTARKRAAQALANQLQKLLIRYGSAQHFIIAHSHGGNVAYYTLRDHPELQDAISGLICLSTPFLYVQKRILSKSGKRILVFVPIFSFPFLYFSLFTQNEHFWWGLTIISIVSWLMGCWLFSKLEPWSKNIEAAMTMALPISTNVFIVRTAADEASLVLMACQIASWLLNKLVILLASPALIAKWLEEKVTKHSWRGQVIWFLTILGLPAAFLNVYIALHKGGYYSPVVLVLFYDAGPVIAALLAFILALAAFPVLLVSLVIIPIMGPKLALSHIFLDIAVEPAPPGTHAIRQFGFRADFKDKIKAFFNHSLPYQTPEIIEGIVKWIKVVSSKKACVSTH